MAFKEVNVACFPACYIWIILEGFHTCRSVLWVDLRVREFQLDLLYFWFSPVIVAICTVYCLLHTKTIFGSFMTMDVKLPESCRPLHSSLNEVRLIHVRKNMLSQTRRRSVGYKYDSVDLLLQLSSSTLNIMHAQNKKQMKVDQQFSHLLQRDLFDCSSKSAAFGSGVALNSITKV